MIKTRLESLTVMVENRELKVGDRVKVETITKNDGHNNIYEVVELKIGTPNICKNYYEVKREDGTTIVVEATWFDNSTRKTYLIEN